jgi:hypothetical protein
MQTIGQAMSTAAKVGFKRKPERDAERDIFGGHEFTMPGGSVACNIDLDPIRKPGSFLQGNISTRPNTSLQSSFETLSSIELADFVRSQTDAKGDSRKIEK